MAASHALLAIAAAIALCLMAATATNTQPASSVRLARSDSRVIQDYSQSEDLLNMLRIYTIPVSLYCAKLRILLRHKGLAWEELPPPGGYGSDAYKLVVPSGNLPALIDEDVLIADSEAIAEYLEESYPDPAMLPLLPADRARVREHGRFHDTRLEPALRGFFPYLPGRSVPPDGFIEAQADIVASRLRQLAQMLGETAGNTLNLGDCGYPPTFAWLDAVASHMGFTLDWPEELKTYRKRLTTHPAVAAELADYEPIVARFMEG